jgi:hypothetical protein
LFDPDTHRNSLRKSNPGEDRVDVWKALLAAFAALMPPVMLSILPPIGAWKPSSVASTGSPTWMLASFVSSK